MDEVVDFRYNKYSSLFRATGGRLGRGDRAGMGREKVREKTVSRFPVELSAILSAEPNVTREMIWNVKQQYFTSWPAMATAMGYDSDSSVTGPLAHPEKRTEKFKLRFFNLVRRLRKEEGEFYTISSHYKLPTHFYISSRARKCVCGLWFIPRVPNQRKHTKTCVRCVAKKRKK